MTVGVSTMCSNIAWVASCCAWVSFSGVAAATPVNAAADALNASIWRIMENPPRKISCATLLAQNLASRRAAQLRSAEASST